MLHPIPDLRAEIRSNDSLTSIQIGVQRLNLKLRLQNSRQRPFPNARYVQILRLDSQDFHVRFNMTYNRQYRTNRNTLGQKASSNSLPVQQHQVWPSQSNYSSKPKTTSQNGANSSEENLIKILK